MKKVDFLFVYEIKVREFENICLLRVELEKRGYSVEFSNTWQTENKMTQKYKAKVLVAFACYDNENLGMLSRCAGEFDRVVNLQWEQIMPKAEEDHPASIWNIKELAKEVTHICWGQQTVDRLSKICGVPQKNLKRTGFIALDFCKPLLLQYSKSRENLFAEYNLDPKKRTVLFISSFAYVGLPDVQLKYIEFGRDIQKYRHISNDTHAILMQWFSCACEENPDIQFIYRPHPAEVNIPVLNQMQQEYANFYVIRKDSMRQWILSSDDIYLWMSTGIVETYAARKKCNVLRPLPIPPEMDIPLYADCEAIAGQSEFLEAIKNPRDNFPIAEENIHYFYDFSNVESYKSVCDVLEAELMACDGKNTLQNKLLKSVKPPRQLGLVGVRTMPWKERLFYFAVDKFNYSEMMLSIMEHTPFSFGPFKKWRKQYNKEDSTQREQRKQDGKSARQYHKEKAKQNYVSRKERRDVMRAIKGCLSGKSLDASL